jgi:peptide/nickel transport system substrate-binding protein
LIVAPGNWTSLSVARRTTLSSAATVVVVAGTVAAVALVGAGGHIRNRVVPGGRTTLVAATSHSGADRGSRTAVDGNPKGTGAPFARTSPLSPSTVKGGTLKVGSAGDVDYLDPARTYYAFSWDIHQLFNRTLLTFPDGTGSPALVPTGDIATGPATPTNHGKTWSYTLKSGVKFQDGTSVTSESIKYAIERTFATSVINGGPTYFATFLCPGGEKRAGDCSTYKGPYRGKSSVYGLSTIQTPDPTHIVFNLNQPFAEWNFVMTLFGTSPVEVSVDQKPRTGGANYNNHVQATGPYEISSYVANRHIDLVRNPNYNPATDGTRSALPNKIDITTSFDAPTLDNSIIAGRTDLDIVGEGVQPATEQKILSTPSLAKRTLDPITGFTRYLSILQETKPFNNLHCREAVEYAMSRDEQKLARGGDYGAAIATTLGPPTLAGWKNFNEYPGTATGKSRVKAAKHQLKLCGKPKGFTTTIVVTNQGTAPQQAQFLQNDLKRIGIVADIKTFDPATYYSSVVGVPRNIKKDGYGLAFAGWGPDWPAPYGFFEDIIDPRAILAQGNSNYGACADPRITALIKKATRQATAAASYPYWRQVDMLVNKDACVAPYSYDKAVDVFSKRLTNAYIEPQYGIVDLRAVGID